MRIAVTGRAGQVASSLRERCAALPGIELVCVGRPGFDLARPDGIARALAAAEPDIIVSAAGYTAVQDAETHPREAFLVNRDGAGLVARAADRIGIPVIHLSTDYVFDGALGRPYTESDAPNPLNVYGASKLAGEDAVRRQNARHVIIRTAWIYSPFGSNFVRTMLRLASERQTVSVVCDQFGCPTSAFDLADAILAAIPRITETGWNGFGTYHLAGSGTASWSDLAEQVFVVSRRLGGPSARIDRIASSEFPSPVARPADTRLSSVRFNAAFGHALPRWQDSVALVVERLCAGPAIAAERTGLPCASLPRMNLPT